MNQIYPYVYTILHHGDQFVVEIYGNSRSMQRRAHEIGMIADKRCGAYCGIFTGEKDNHGKFKAVILLKNSQFGAGVLAHEFTHAALGWFSFRKKWRNVLPFRYHRRGWNRREEKLATLIGDLNREFWLQWHRRNEKPKKASV